MRRKVGRYARAISIDVVVQLERIERCFSKLNVQRSGVISENTIEDVLFEVVVNARYDWSNALSKEAFSQKMWAEGKAKDCQPVRR